MKFQVGDKVRVKSWVIEVVRLDMEEKVLAPYYFTDEMLDLIEENNEFTIESFQLGEYGEYIHLVGNGWSWDKRWLEPIDELKVVEL